MSEEETRVRIEQEEREGNIRSHFILYAIYVVIGMIIGLLWLALSELTPQTYLSNPEVHAQAITVTSALFGFSGVITVYRHQSLGDQSRREYEKYSNYRGTWDDGTWDAKTIHIVYRLYRRKEHEGRRWLLFSKVVALLFTVALVTEMFAYVHALDSTALPLLAGLAGLAPYLAVVGGMGFLFQLLMLQ